MDSAFCSGILVPIDGPAVPLGQFLPRCKQVFAERFKKATPTMFSATQLYDDLIQVLKSGTFWID